MKCCLVSSDISWHIRDKLWPMPKHGPIILYVHGNLMVSVDVKNYWTMLRLVRTDSPGRPPRLSHSSWTMPVYAFLAFMLLYVHGGEMGKEWGNGERVGRGRESERLDRGNRPKKTGETVDRRQNNGSVKAVSPRHCPATCALRNCCFNCCAGQSH